MNPLLSVLRTKKDYTYAEMEVVWHLPEFRLNEHV